MLSSNSFNLCPHCGNSNTLNARFCARCGTQLKVPEEVVVCRTCGTRNSPMANFCRNCGSQLKVGEQTKICPRCRKEVPASDNTCTCGYSFATITTVAPTAGKAVSAGNERKNKKQKGVRAGKSVVSKKGGRAFAIVAMVFLLVFAYFFVAPQNLRPSFLAFDKGLVTVVSSGAVLYGFDFAKLIALGLIDAFTGPQEHILEGVLFAFGGSSANVGQMILSVMTVIFAFSALIHFIVCFTRMFTSKRSKKANKFYLVLAVLTTIATALILLPQILGADFLGGVLNLFALEGVTLGWVVCAIPAYYWFFFIYSAIAKGKSLTEQVA